MATVGSFFFLRVGRLFTAGRLRRAISFSVQMIRGFAA
jgi:hypothetical protein